MKIVKSSEMARIEREEYALGVSEEAFMNQAGVGIAQSAQRMIAKRHLKPHILFLCGKGNNGGDGYVAARLLKEGGFHVKALSFASQHERSPLCQLQAERFLKTGGEVECIERADAIDFGDAELLVDALLGTGFRGEVKGLLAACIEKANASKKPIISIDIPSGIDGESGKIGGIAICATETVFLGLPKTGCFLGESWNDVGVVSIYNFGLSQRALSEAKEDFILLEKEEMKKLLPPLVRTRHKYSAGYVVGIGGHFGMPGAPMLSSLAALKAGAGIVRLLHPIGMEAEFASAPYELVREGYKPGDTKKVLEAMKKASALFIGPGMGKEPVTARFLKKLFAQIEKPCVIDADALTLIAAHEMDLPNRAILTPHHGEMKRLLGLQEELSIASFLERVSAYVNKMKVTLVLKGSPTFIFHPKETPRLCVRGDPGMATAGSGDVLTGMIAALLSQHMKPLDAALLGVYLHGMAGEYAAEKCSSYTMIASNIIEELPLAFKELIL